MKRILLSILILIFSPMGFSQQIVCEKTYGNNINTSQINAIARYDSNSILLSGPINVSGSFDTYILKVNLDCDTTWTKIGVNVPNGDQDIEILNDGTFLFYGTINGVSGNPGDNRDLILEKRSLLGDTIWRKRIGYGANQEYATRMVKLSDGSFLLAGNIDGALGASDMLLVKVNSEGIEQWRNRWGWDYSDYGMNITTTVDGDFVLAGFSQDGITGTVYTRFLKINQSGDSILSKHVIVSGDSSYYEKMRFTYSKLSNTSDKGFLFTATLDSNSNDYDFIAKVDSSFNIKWKYIDNVAGNIFSKAYELADSSVIVLVSKGGPVYDNKFYLYKFNKNGQKTGTLTFTSTECSQVRVTEMEYAGDSTFFVAGACLADNNVYVAKLDKIGVPITIDTCNSFRASFKAVQNGDSLQFLNTSNGGYAYANESIWKFSDSTTSTSFNPKFEVTETQDSVWVRLIATNPYGCKDTIEKKVKVDQITGTVDKLKEKDWQVIVYPNPSSGVFNFKNIGNNSKSYNLTLVNSIGLEAGKFSFDSKEFSIDTSLSSGIYFYMMIDEKRNSVKGKLVID